MDKFSEIEHKFVLAKDFDKTGFLQSVRSLKPRRENKINVVDRYYFLSPESRFIFRYRSDEELQQLSVKSLGDDNEARLEVNLDLAFATGDQSEAVEAFLRPFGVSWQGRIDKVVEVFYFDDCEIVFYEAKSQLTSVSCIEFEAKHFASSNEALGTLEKYENKLGFSREKRETKNLFELLLRGLLPKK